MQVQHKVLSQVSLSSERSVAPELKEAARSDEIRSTEYTEYMEYTYLTSRQEEGKKEVEGFEGDT